jgi:hypothetical protein
MVDEFNQMYLPFVTSLKLPSDKLADELIKLFIRWKPQKVGIELGLQEHFKYILEYKITEWENDHQKSLGYVVDANIVPIKYSLRISKGSRVDRSFGAFVREGSCYIHKDNTSLMRQMELFTGKGKEEDDMVDAVSMLFSLVDRFAQRYWVKPKQNSGTLLDLFKPPKKGWEQRFANN